MLIILLLLISRLINCEGELTFADNQKWKSNTLQADNHVCNNYFWGGGKYVHLWQIFDLKRFVMLSMVVQSNAFTYWLHCKFGSKALKTFLAFELTSVPLCASIGSDWPIDEVGALLVNKAHSADSLTFTECLHYLWIGTYLSTNWDCQLKLCRMGCYDQIKFVSCYVIILGGNVQCYNQIRFGQRAQCQYSADHYCALVHRRSRGNHENERKTSKRLERCNKTWG